MPQVALVLWLLTAAANDRMVPEVQSWTPIGPTIDGATVAINSLAFDPVTGVLYAGSALDPNAPTSTRVFRRPLDTGAWTEAAPPGVSGVFSFVELTVDSVGSVYASVSSCLLHPGFGCGGGLARSDDGGAQWTLLRLGATSSVRVDPFDTRQVLAVGRSSVSDPAFPPNVSLVQTALMSIDSGSTWMESSSPPSPNSFEFDPTRVGAVYASSFNGVWKSIDFGSTWFSVSDGIEEFTNAIAVDAAGAVYVSAYEGVFVSRDTGLHWRRSGLTLLAQVLIADPAGGVYAGTESGVFHVDPIGVAAPVGSGLTYVTGLATDGRRVWAGSADGVFELELRNRVTRVVPPRGP